MNRVDIFEAETVSWAADGWAPGCAVGLQQLWWPYRPGRGLGDTTCTSVSAGTVANVHRYN